jgi:hypothetical protein
MPNVPEYVKTAAIAAVAAGTGLAVGYWLGGRRAARRRPSFRLSDYGFSGGDATDVARLVPDVAHLMKNPFVRAMATRIVVRQLSRMLAA